MRFLMCARRVIHSEKEKKTMPPKKSLRFRLSNGAGGWLCGGRKGAEGGDGPSFWADVVLSGVVDAFESEEPAPQPKKDTMIG